MSNHWNQRNVDSLNQREVESQNQRKVLIKFKVERVEMLSETDREARLEEKAGREERKARRRLGSRRRSHLLASPRQYSSWTCGKTRWRISSVRKVGWQAWTPPEETSPERRDVLLSARPLKHVQRKWILTSLKSLTLLEKCFILFCFDLCLPAFFVFSCFVLQLTWYHYVRSYPK